MITGSKLPLFLKPVNYLVQEEHRENSDLQDFQPQYQQIVHVTPTNKRSIIIGSIEDNQ